MKFGGHDPYSIANRSGIKNLYFENRLSQCAIYEVAHIANLELI